MKDAIRLGLFERLFKQVRKNQPKFTDILLLVAHFTAPPERPKHRRCPNGTRFPAVQLVKNPLQTLKNIARPLNSEHCVPELAKHEERLQKRVQVARGSFILDPRVGRLLLTRKFEDAELHGKVGEFLSLKNRAEVVGQAFLKKLGLREEWGSTAQHLQVHLDGALEQLSY